MNKRFDLKNILLISSLIIIIILLAVLIVIILDKKKEENIINDNNETKNSYILAKEALTLIPKHVCGGIEFPFNKDNVTLSDLSDMDKVNMVLYHYNDNVYVEGNPDYVDFTINEDNFKKYFENIEFINIIKNNDYEKSDMYLIDPYRVTYKDNLFYLSKYPTGCESFDTINDDIIYKDSSIKDNTLIVTVYYLYYSYDEIINDTGTNLVKKIYKDNTKTEYVTDEKDLDYSLLDTYDIYFDISNDNLRFQKMIRHSK